MEISLLLMQQIAQLFLILIMGYTWRKQKCSDP